MAQEQCNKSNVRPFFVPRRFTRWGCAPHLVDQKMGVHKQNAVSRKSLHPIRISILESGFSIHFAQKGMFTISALEKHCSPFCRPVYWHQQTVS